MERDMGENTGSAFRRFIRELKPGGLPTEDVVRCFLPLAHNVLDVHLRGLVVDWRQLDSVRFSDHRLRLVPGAELSPRLQHRAVETIEAFYDGAVELAETGDLVWADRPPGEAFDRPVLLPDYECWEWRLDHHDALSDIYVLGLVLASMACGLTLEDHECLQKFAAHRHNLFRLCQEVHPVVARAVRLMAEPRRQRRISDLAAVIRSLENYRDSRVELEFELEGIDGFHSKDLLTKEQIILARLQQRLFDASRRNRLLHFRPTMGSVNLTLASTPLSEDVRRVSAEQILTWNDDLRQQLARGTPMRLSRFLNFSEALYLPSSLERIRADSRRDMTELGFAQLRLAVCFLSWTNLKVEPPERFDSPLVLVPVELSREKGVRDAYWLKATSDEAEVNPALRRLFQQLYAIDLPETLDLSVDSVGSLYQYLRDRVAQTEAAVVFELMDRPVVEEIRRQAQRRLEQYRRRARLDVEPVTAQVDAGAAEPLVKSAADDAPGDSGTITRPGSETPPATEAAAGPLGSSASPVNDSSGGAASAPFVANAPNELDAAVDSAAPTAATSNSGDGPSDELSQPAPDGAMSLTSRPGGSAESGPASATYRLRDAHADNPYVWTFNLCHVTLANFRYHRMSLVRDYDALLSEQISSQAFDAVFRLSPRAAAENVAGGSLAERYDVLTCDPTQAAAITGARRRQTYIIQGPPGTGKSQTIANLIADYVARGCRILFVCEKRAAIDVVYSRLKQQGLDDQCCLIHDSQADKKAFVHELRRTYEKYLAGGPPAADPRPQAVEKLLDALAPLVETERLLTSVPTTAGLPLRALLLRLVTLRQQLPATNRLAAAPVAATYEQWLAASESLGRLQTMLADVQPDCVFAHHPLHLLAGNLARDPQAAATITAPLATAGELLDGIRRRLAAASVGDELQHAPELHTSILPFAHAAESLARKGQACLADKAGNVAQKFDAGWQELSQLHEQLEQARQKTTHWRKRLPADEARQALQQWDALEGDLLRWLKPRWWRLRRALRAGYDFSAHAILPTWRLVLERLCQEYDVAAEYHRAGTALLQQFALDGDADSWRRTIDALRRRLAEAPEASREFLTLSLQAPDADARLLLLAEAATAHHSLVDLLRPLIVQPERFSLAQLDREVHNISQALDQLPRLQPCLAAIAQLPSDLADLIRHVPGTLAELEQLIAERTLQDAYLRQPHLRHWTEQSRRQQVEAVAAAYDRWLQANGASVCGAARRGFLERLQLSAAPAGQLTAPQKEWKKQYLQGRRELEREFAKTMRYRSIRELISGATGLVVRDLKPVWLMSPLSVADALPLDPEQFDVVIFDEASQITLEEAVPTLYRAPQAIIVGDEMQLPPTSFFTRRDEDDLEVTWEEDGEQLAYDLASESLLNHAARHLPSTMLGWHYRSRNELLIAFSNAVFYRRRLLTVPEEQLTTLPRSELNIHDPSEGDAMAEAVLDRAVSFHRLRASVYQQRRNRQEADYIAHLVRGLLQRETGLTCGVVAFSEAQQEEIEAALQRLAEQDPAFRERLEVEYEREEDGQFCGLLVKNLENIQGDERDIVILSVCYGPDAEGALRMHFGPINMSGGEKRLNVAFSRAKHHMVVVSSIHGDQITNDYNDGARCLKNYLRYAAAVSTGDGPAVKRILDELSPFAAAAQTGQADGQPAAAAEMADQLRRHGWLVDARVGHSEFQCDLAVRGETDVNYRLAILFDQDLLASSADRLAIDESALLLEHALLRPRLLKNFGWQVEHVLVREWHEQPDAVLARVLKRLEEAAGNGD
jgi:hypothetical protein